MATMTRWDPFQDLRSAQDEMAQMPRGPMLAHALGLHGQPQGSDRATAWAPALDISERKDAYLVTVELPGVEADDLDITLEDGLLTIQGERHFAHDSSEQQFHRVERRYGAFRRSITLPAHVRPRRSRPRSTTACSRSWCPRWRRPLPSASRSAPVERPSLRQAVRQALRTRRPAEASGGVAGPATPPCSPRPPFQPERPPHRHQRASSNGAPAARP